jgi:[ribosomal protein S18]-alanine N-acetyltransferase
MAEGSSVVYGFGQHWIRTTGTAHLGRIIVSPESRGKGFGRLLCRKLIFRAVELTGAAAVTLRVYTDNAPAIALYKSLGFLRVEDESSDVFLLMRIQTSVLRDDPAFEP